MNDNPYNAPKAFEMASGSAEEPVVKNYALHFLKKSSATLLLGIILAAFNFFGGTYLAIVCTSGTGYIPDFFPHSLTFMIVGLGATALAASVALREFDNLSACPTLVSFCADVDRRSDNTPADGWSRPHRPYRRT